MGLWLAILVGGVAALLWRRSDRGSLVASWLSATTSRARSGPSLTQVIRRLVALSAV